MVRQTTGEATGVRATDWGEPFRRKLAVAMAAKSLQTFCPFWADTGIPTSKSSRRCVFGPRLNNVPYSALMFRSGTAPHGEALQPGPVTYGGRQMFCPAAHERVGEGAGPAGERLVAWFPV